MYDCEKCPYSTYKKFYDYYGAYDYGNQWVTAAFNKAKASFNNGSADFTQYGADGINGEELRRPKYFSILTLLLKIVHV